MSTITGYKQRLRAMIFKIHFKEKVDEIKPVRHARASFSNNY